LAKHGVIKRISVFREINRRWSRRANALDFPTGNLITRKCALGRRGRRLHGRDQPAEGDTLTVLALVRLAERVPAILPAFSVITARQPVRGDVFDTDPRCTLNFRSQGSTAVWQKAYSPVARVVKKRVWQIGGHTHHSSC